MDIVESIERYLEGSPTTKGERTRLVRARDEIVRLRKDTPPAASLKPLTDDEADRAIKGYWGEMKGAPLEAHRLYLRAIEAKLKENNV